MGFENEFIPLLSKKEMQREGHKVECTMCLVATFAIAALSLPAIAYPNIILEAQQRCLDEAATRRPSREAVGATVELGLEVIASKYTERCPRVFGFDICGPLADVAITRIASSVTEWMGTTRGIMGDYYACHRGCRMAGGRKGSPDEPDSCKGACEALHSRDDTKRARNFVLACLELANLHPAVRAVYNRAANWCTPAGERIE